MPTLDDAFITQALGDEMIARVGLGTSFQGLAIDSRKVQTGELFIALAGEKHDGHAFIEAALGKGAVGVIADARWPGHLQGMRLMPCSIGYTIVSGHFAKSLQLGAKDFPAR